MVRERERERGNVTARFLIICRKSDTILKCSGSALNGSFVGFWDWVEEAEYNGKRNETGVTLDFWKSTVQQKVCTKLSVLLLIFAGR